MKMESEELIEMYMWILAAIAVIPLVLDICLAYWSKCKMRQVLVNEAARNQLDQAELQEFIKELGKSPPGISGLARTVMALTVIVILGIAVLHLLVQGSEDTRIVENVLSMLAGLLAAITGFYFGGRAAERKPEETKKTPAPDLPGKTSNSVLDGANGAHTNAATNKKKS
jgi:hypothetical protein